MGFSDWAMQLHSDESELDQCPFTASSSSCDYPPSGASTSSYLPPLASVFHTLAPPSLPPPPPLPVDSLNRDACGGCAQPITDRFYLSVIEKRWHAGCLRCCVCEAPLDSAVSCFTKDGRIYCKLDYFRTFGARRCSRCMAQIGPTELVMRAKQLVFHVQCFSCIVCNHPLSKGDRYGIRNNVIVCGEHVDIPSAELPTPSSHDLPSCSYQTTTPPSGPTVKRKGRPRKRKPEAGEVDLSGDFLGENTTGASTSGQQKKTKRMRTSFKHHQLRELKAYFAVNHNPDAKDLAKLSLKTGLPKQVLQVWFQNARAKWRRTVAKQSGSESES